MHYHFKVYPEDNGFWAECIELHGCQTQADSIKELKENMHQALNLYLSEQDDSTVIYDLPQKNLATQNVYQINVEPKIALSFLLRRYRLLHNLTQKQAAEKIGMKNLWSYQKFEKPASANPTLSMLTKFKEVFPDLNLDYIFS
ncbi:MAG: type II toxin-antitoxin system HicB family antitoxin [Candidatus Cloacimonetes bacterium]|nr:type II toxin-antitoxin system HicB family antitoxin [Candidatus Cloacimonadota bacterium]